MDVATVASTVAITVAVIGGLVSGYAAIRQRKTEDVQVVVSAMRDHMGTLGKDNDDLRTRVFAAEQRVVDLTAQVTRCESDKADMGRQVDELRRRLDASIN